MKNAVFLVLCLLLAGCTSFEVRQRSTAQLRARYVQIERNLADYHPEETDAAKLRRFRNLTEEGQSVERELFRRCKAGDTAACLPHFHLIAPDI